MFREIPTQDSRFTQLPTQMSSFSTLDKELEEIDDIFCSINLSFARTITQEDVVEDSLRIEDYRLNDMCWVKSMCGWQDGADTDKGKGITYRDLKSVLGYCIGQKEAEEESWIYYIPKLTTRNPGFLVKYQVEYPEDHNAPPSQFLRIKGWSRWRSRSKSSSSSSKQKKSKGKAAKEHVSHTKKATKSPSELAGESGGANQPKRVRFALDEQSQRSEVTSQVTTQNAASLATIQTCPSSCHDSAGQSV
ncbi:hypothetical protein Tco_1219799 [Tanacetum coccineum]